MLLLRVVPVTEYCPPPMSSASGLPGPISEHPHNSIERAASDALVIKRIFAPITAYPGTAGAVFVTRITSETPSPRPASLRSALRENSPGQPLFVTVGIRTKERARHEARFVPSILRERHSNCRLLATSGTRLVGYPAADGSPVEHGAADVPLVIKRRTHRVDWLQNGQEAETRSGKDGTPIPQPAARWLPAGRSLAVRGRFHETTGRIPAGTQLGRKSVRNFSNAG